MTELEWERVAKKENKKSTLSIFSKRTRSAHKCALECAKMTNVLVILQCTN